MQRMWIIDGTAILLRYWFSLPDNWSDDKGNSTTALYGWFQYLFRLLANEMPEHIAVCFDESLHQGFRHQLYTGYKENRGLPDDALGRQLTLAKTWTQQAGVQAFASNYYEADDLIASIAVTAKMAGMAVTVISRDKDLGQVLVDDTDFLWDWKENNQASNALNPAAFESKHGVPPGVFKELIGLAGDSSDSIPGVSGIGLKTAKTLVNHFSTLENLYADLEQLEQLNIRGKRRIKQRLEEGRELAFLSRELATLAIDPGIVTDIQTCRLAAPSDTFDDWLEEMGLAQLLKHPGYALLTQR